MRGTELEFYAAVINHDSLRYFELKPPEMTRKSLPFSHLHEMTVRIDILVTFDVSVGKSELKIKQDITQFRP